MEMTILERARNKYSGIRPLRFRWCEILRIPYRQDVPYVFSKSKKTTTRCLRMRVKFRIRCSEFTRCSRVELWRRNQTEHSKDDLYYLGTRKADIHHTLQGLIDRTNQGDGPVTSCEGAISTGF
jgi:hypothetical protein